MKECLISMMTFLWLNKADVTNQKLIKGVITNSIHKFALKQQFQPFNNNLNTESTQSYHE